jgi:hypothetical protein
MCYCKNKEFLFTGTYPDATNYAQKPMPQRMACPFMRNSQYTRHIIK